MKFLHNAVLTYNVPLLYLKLLRLFDTCQFLSNSAIFTVTLNCMRISIWLRIERIYSDYLGESHLRIKTMNCLSLCENINATCQSACNADMVCIQECSREFIDCTSFCPESECDVGSLTLEEKIKLNRSLGWSLYDAKSEVNWWKARDHGLHG